MGMPPNELRPIYLMNGSVTAMRIDTKMRRRSSYAAMMRGEHMTSHVRLRKFGYELAPLPFPAILYVFNHGDNLEVYRGKGASKLAELENSTTDFELYRQVCAEFEIPE